MEQNPAPKEGSFIYAITYIYNKPTINTWKVMELYEETTRIPGYGLSPWLARIARVSSNNTTPVTVDMETLKPLAADGMMKAYFYTIGQLAAYQTEALREQVNKYKLQIEETRDTMENLANLLGELGYVKLYPGDRHYRQLPPDTTDN